MKNQQNNTSALSALLRTANSGDTLETNSLCCAAAGIIAPSSTTAEALIPHEKLRGAALNHATLTAHKRPLAQLVVVYTTPLNEKLVFPFQFAQSNLPSFQLCITAFKQLVSFRAGTAKTNNKGVIPLKSPWRLQKAHQVQDALTKLKSQKCSLLVCIRYVVSYQAQKLPKIPVPPTQLNFKICLDKAFNSLKQEIEFSHKKENITRQGKFSSRSFNMAKTLICSIRLLSYKRVMAPLNLANPKGSDDCRNRPNSLNPSRRAVGGPTFCNKHHCHTSSKCTQRRERNHQNRPSFDRDLSWNHQWLHAITKSRILTKFQTSVYGGAV